MTDKTTVEAIARWIGAKRRDWISDEMEYVKNLRSEGRENELRSKFNSAIDVHLAQAALDALKANGFAVVPVKPTETMVQAGGKAYMMERKMFDVYRAMIAAA